MIEAGTRVQTQTVVFTARRAYQILLDWREVNILLELSLAFLALEHEVPVEILGQLPLLWRGCRDIQVEELRLEVPQVFVDDAGALVS